MHIMVLGELIEESGGKKTSDRVLDVETLKMESSFTMEETYRGTHCTDIGTYTFVLRRGVVYGEGQGIITAKDGQGIATSTGQGIGKVTSSGKVSFRGSVFFKTPSASEVGKLSYLDNMVGVFEDEVDEKGNCSSKTWEWK